MDNPAAAEGRALRSELPRSGHAELVLPQGRDPVAILEGQHVSRLAGLVPTRIGRMLQSPFAYYRGTAAVMTADLAAGPSTGVHVVCCGDAHVSNFGFFASPERTLMFDLNDFDETGIAPWEWDVKRLAASVHIGGREVGMGEDDCRSATVLAVAAYRESLRELMEMSALDRYYFRVDAERVRDMVRGKATRKALEKARARTADRLLDALAVRDEDGGGLRIIDDPPIARHAGHATREQVDDLYRDYLSTLREDSAWLLAQFRPVDFVLRVVGVGSVGTRCYVIALEGPAGEVLFLQVKEAEPSVLTTYGGMPSVITRGPEGAVHSEGHRVVAGQRILQAQSDPFLGHIIGFAGERREHDRVDYYWRQFRDMKGSIDPSQLDGEHFTAYGELCGRLLARAHGQSPGAAPAAGYLGGGGRFDESVADWAAAYADVCAQDYEELRAAVRSGRLPADTEPDD